MRNILLLVSATVSSLFHCGLLGPLEGRVGMAGPASRTFSLFNRVIFSFLNCSLHLRRLRRVGSVAHLTALFKLAVGRVVLLSGGRDVDAGLRIVRHPLQLVVYGRLVRHGALSYLYSLHWLHLVVVLIRGLAEELLDILGIHSSRVGRVCGYCGHSCDKVYIFPIVDHWLTLISMALVVDLVHGLCRVGLVLTLEDTCIFASASSCPCTLCWLVIG